MRKSPRAWSEPLEKVGWVWVAPALVTAGSLGVYWAARHWPRRGRIHALDLLREDHRRIEDLLRRLQKAPSAEESMELVRSIEAELHLHAALEKEIFYPALFQASLDQGGVEVSEAEHQECHRLLAELQAGHLRSAIARRQAVQHFLRCVRDHFDHEENVLFVRAQQASLDMHRLGRRLQERQVQLRRAASALKTK